MDRLLGHGTRGDARAVSELLTPGASVRIVDATGSVALEGEVGRQRLIDALVNDPALRWRQLRSELFAGNPTAAYLLIYQNEAGTRAARVLVVTAAGQRLASVAWLATPLAATAADAASD